MKLISPFLNTHLIYLITAKAYSKQWLTKWTMSSHTFCSIMRQPSFAYTVTIAPGKWQTITSSYCKCTMADNPPPPPPPRTKHLVTFWKKWRKKQQKTYSSLGNSFLQSDFFSEFLPWCNCCGWLVVKNQFPSFLSSPPHYSSPDVFVLCVLPIFSVSPPPTFNLCHIQLHFSLPLSPQHPLKKEEEKVERYKNVPLLICLFCFVLRNETEMGPFKLKHRQECVSFMLKHD